MTSRSKKKPRKTRWNCPTLDKVAYDDEDGWAVDLFAIAKRIKVHPTLENLYAIDQVLKWLFNGRV